MSTASIDTVITDAGFDLLRAAPGHKLVYTRAVCGSGHVEKTQLATLTEISDYVMDLSIVEFGPSESAATLRLQLDNSKAPKEFQLYQIGVLAKLLDGEEELVGETLVQVMQYEKPDIVRAVPHVSEFVVNVLMGQAETVEGTIDMAAYVSIRQFSSRTVNGKPLSADVTITGEDIKVSVSDQTTVEAALSNKAEKVSPQKYNLPLTSDFTQFRSCNYFKTQENIVVLTIDAKSANPIVSGSIVATLPEGFHPLNTTVVQCIVDDTGKKTGHIIVANSGKITVNTGFNDAMYVNGQVTFLAAD